MNEFTAETAENTINHRLTQTGTEENSESGYDPYRHLMQWSVKNNVRQEFYLFGEIADNGIGACEVATEGSNLGEGVARTACSLLYECNRYSFILVKYI